MGYVGEEWVKVGGESACECQVLSKILPSSVVALHCPTLQTEDSSVVQLIAINWTKGLKEKRIPIIYHSL